MTEQKKTFSGDLKKRLFLSVMLLLTTFAFSQSQLRQSRARAKIDSLRYGFDYKSADAYRNANQAKHLDSTYYVGYLIEGYHFFEKAEEHSGLSKAVGPLRKALALFEKEFGGVLNHRITRSEMYSGAWRDLFRQLDYYDISNRLISTYITLEQPDSAYRATLRLRKKDLVFDFQSLHWLSWLYFRSRIFTSDKYRFMGDSIEENMRMAIAFTDSMEARYRRNVPFIKSQIMSVVVKGSPFYKAFDNSFVKAPLSTIANTRGILYGYNLNPELAASYFKKIDGEDNLAKTVNLGFTYLSAIDFREAESYFSKVPDRGSRSRGGHWQGYSMIYVSKDEPLAGAVQLKEDRDNHGYTIGYGWDNLCIARMFLYSGNIEACARSLDKADDFNEVHYNTSFREDQYRFMLKTLRLMQARYEIQAHKFENRRHWLSFDWWKDIPGLTYDKYTTLYKLANEMTENPERNMVYYHPFHTESIISFDELWYIIKNYSNDYFLKKLKAYDQTDPRQQADRYYKYYIGKLLKAAGSSEAAYDMLTGILNSGKLDKINERLLIARIHENCAEIAADNDWGPQVAFHTNLFYQTYPELVPFSDVRMSFRLTPANTQNPALQKVLSQLERFNINWQADESGNYPDVQFSLNEQNQLQYQVMVNREVFTQGYVDLSTPDAANKLAYRLFKIYR